MLLVGRGWETGMDPERALASTSWFHLHPRGKGLNIGYPSPNGHKCNQLATFQGVGGGRGIGGPCGSGNAS